MALPTFEVGGDYEIWRVCKFSEEKKIIQEQVRKKKTGPDLNKKNDNLLDNRKYTSIKRLLNVVKLCLLLICSANFKSSFADICVYIYIFYRHLSYIFYRHLSIFFKLVWLTLMSCCFTCLCSKFPPQKWGQIYGWRSGGSACLKIVARRLDGFPGSLNVFH